MSINVIYAHLKSTLHCLSSVKRPWCSENKFTVVWEWKGLSWSSGVTYGRTQAIELHTIFPTSSQMKCAWSFGKVFWFMSSYQLLHSLHSKTSTALNFFFREKTVRWRVENFSLPLTSTAWLYLVNFEVSENKTRWSTFKRGTQKCTFFTPLVFFWIISMF